MRPAAPFMQKIRVGLRPRRGRPRPPPGRLSTQVLFPAVTRRTKCPPGASNKNCAVDLTVHFKGASRAHGPGREVREPHPGQPSALQRPFWGPCNPHPSTTPACSRPPPPAAPRPRAPLPTAPPGRTELSWKRLRGDRASDPTFYSRALLWGGGRLGLRVAPKSIAIGGLFLFPGSRAVTELPGPYQSAAGSSRLPRAGLREPVIPPRQSQRRSAGPRRPP